MWAEENPAAEMRALLKSLLPEKAFLRRDRGSGLFVSNAPVFAPDLKALPSFYMEKEGMLLRIFPDESWIERIEHACGGMDADLCRSLERFRGENISPEAMTLLCAGLKILDAGDSALPGEIEVFDRNVRQLAARALRGGICGGGIYALSLLDARIKT